MKSLIGLALIVPSMSVRGWAIKLTWLWFIVPVTGMRPIGWGAAYGLAVFCTALSMSDVDIMTADKLNKEDKNRIIYPLVSMVILFITVGIGWIVKTYLL